MLQEMNAWKWSRMDIFTTHIAEADSAARILGKRSCECLILILHLPWCKGGAAPEGAQGAKTTLKLICTRPKSPHLVPNTE